MSKQQNATMYVANAKNFSIIPGQPIAYWWNQKMLSCFEDNVFLPGNPMKGIQTGKGEDFLRYWFEVEYYKSGFKLVDHSQIESSGLKWFPLTSGGTSRKWYGNFELVVNLKNNGADIRATKKLNYRLKDPQYYFLEGLTWTEVTTKPFTCRYLPEHILFGNGGPVAFQLGRNLFCVMGLLNSILAKEWFLVLAPTMNYGPDQVRNIPYKKCDHRGIDVNVKTNISMSREDWNSFETSWDFKKHPLI